MIAGLIQESTKQNLDSVPGVKDMPVLGALFRSRDFQNDETELVVIVTPYLVDPTDPQGFRDPDRGYVTATDARTILFGKLNDVYAVPGSAAARRLRPTARAASSSTEDSRDGKALLTSLSPACRCLALAAACRREEQIGWSNRMHTQIVARGDDGRAEDRHGRAGEKLGVPERDAVKSFATCLPAGRPWRGDHLAPEQWAGRHLGDARSG